MGAERETRRLRGMSNAPLLLLALFLVLVWWLGRTMPADGSADQERLAGDDRYTTAAAIATATFDRVDVAHLVTGEDFPDALAGAYAAGSVDGPLLLLTSDDVPRATLDALRDLEVERVVLIGGPGVIGEGVEHIIDTIGYAHERLAGEDRYDTAAAVALAYPDVGELDGRRTAVLASGADFPDALAAGPIVAAGRLPLLLTPPDERHPVVDEVLAALEVESLLVVGGEAAVSDDVVEGYRADGFEVERVAGADRGETAARLADVARDRLGFDASTVVLVRGDDYPDAVAGSANAARSEAPLLLTAGADDIGDATARWLLDACHVERVRVLGGDAVLGDGPLQEAATAAATCEDEATRAPPPIIVSGQAAPGRG